MFKKGMKKIAVVDFGGQYAHLIANRVRRLGMYGEIYPFEGFSPANDPDIAGIIFSGGPRSVTENDGYTVDFDILETKVPLLGICYGHQLIARLAGGAVAAGSAMEYGLVRVECSPDSTLFKGIAPGQNVWMSHGDHVEKLPPGFRSIASSEKLETAAFESLDSRVFGVQFHPEVTHTENGMKIIDNFLSLCGSEREWKISDVAAGLIEKIKIEACGKKIFLLASGGVDSLVALTLCIRALGNGRVHSLHVDTGFMRENESAGVMKHLNKLGFENLRVVDASERFIGALQGVFDPEEKRKIIGRIFVETLQRELSSMRMGDGWMLAQGTIYPDTIESGGGKKAAKIKTHHNRVKEIEKLIIEGRLIEPLRDLYKDEVRELGISLGLPESLVNRHPFPGPGLAIRVLVSETEIPETGFDADNALVLEIASKFGFGARILPVKSVGVQGDFRSYKHPAVIFAETGENPGWESIAECSKKIVNEVKSVNRVVFSIEKQSEAPVLKKYSLGRDALDLLRKVDSLVNEMTAGIEEIWQMPVVSLPLFDSSGARAFVVRPVCSQNAMTADFYKMDFGLLAKICAGVRKIKTAGIVFYDVTTKPPATIEWE
jgi:GMP synthase (glutamine-hydrolysing)